MDVTSFGVFQFKFFILVLFRVTGLMLLAPFFGSGSIPVKVKILFSLLIAAVIFPYVPQTGISLPGHVGGLVCVAAGELVIGLMIGFAATLILTAVQLGGHWVGQQIGLTLANVIDPVSNIQLSIIEQFKFILAILIFMILNWHHYLLRQLVRTFEIVPVTGFGANRATAEFLVYEMTSEMFMFSMQVAGPFIVALLIVTVAMGFIAKTVPEINIFIIGFGIRIVIGFALLFLALPAMAGLFQRMFEQMGVDIKNLVDLMGPAFI